MICGLIVLEQFQKSIGTLLLWIKFEAPLYLFNLAYVNIELIFSFREKTITPSLLKKRKRQKSLIQVRRRSFFLTLERS